MTSGNPRSGLFWTGLDSMKPEDDWILVADRLQDDCFAEGRLGPYLLGKELRRSRFGTVSLAKHPDIVPVVEIELLETLIDSPLVAPNGLLMGDISMATDLAHRHLAKLIGSGFSDGFPYLVREYRLGRTLDCLLEAGGPSLSLELCVGLLYSIASACDFLSQQGPSPGSCSMGGFDANDLLVGFDGSVRLVGLGLKRARSHDADPIVADLASCFELARGLDDLTEARLCSAIAGAASCAQIALAMRKRNPDACGERVRHLAAALRSSFEDELVEERAFFGMQSLH